jgi:hypothetical protein
MRYKCIVSKGMLLYSRGEHFNKGAVMDIQDTEFGLRYLTQVVAKLKKIGL